MYTGPCESRQTADDNTYTAYVQQLRPHPHPTHKLTSISYCGRKEQTSMAGGFFSYASYISPTLDRFLFSARISLLAGGFLS